MAQYEAIRVLSDIKEDPQSTPEEIRRSEADLERITREMRGVSEAALLGRMNWWTAEYGLIGDVKNPRLFGAGLLSSVGEARACLGPRVKKIPLSVECVDFSYDITEQQPQLFVAEDFSQLSEVLEQLASRLAYRRGGLFGLERAKTAETVNTVQLNSGVQISGVLSDFIQSDDAPVYLQFRGPCQLSAADRELPGQGVGQHAQGFSTPLGLLKGESRCPSLFTPADLERFGLKPGERGKLDFASGVHVEGRVKGWMYRDDKLVLLTWVDCRVTLGAKVLFEPAWGDFDMAVGSAVTSVFGGAADRTSFGDSDDFMAKQIPLRQFTPAQKARHAMFQQLRDLRQDLSSSQARERFSILLNDYLHSPASLWLQGVELLELSHRLGLPDSERSKLLASLQTERNNASSAQDGVALASS
jgi:phenylalanine-4-hydroxylase